MKSKIEDRTDGLEVAVQAAPEEREKLREAFGACAQGRCGCPTNEYEKLEALTMVETDEGMRLTLKAKAGEHMDKDEVARCLEFTESELDGQVKKNG
jgi:hypothetical protein